MSDLNVSTEQKCLHCGSTFSIVIARGTWRKYCNTLCSSRYHAKKAKANLPTCSVPGCSADVRSRHVGYCERHYSRLRRTGTLDTVVDVSKYEKCLHCGESTDNGYGKFCGSRCRARYGRGSSLKANCRVCGKEYISHHKKVCCSKECRSELERIYSRNHYAKWIATSAQFRSKVRNAEYKRKALKQKAFVEIVEIDVVFARDKGICWLCGKDVNPLLKWPNHGYATLDHVMPLSKGGRHSYDNIRLAHMSCNCKKGAKLVA